MKRFIIFILFLLFALSCSDEARERREAEAAMNAALDRRVIRCCKCYASNNAYWAPCLPDISEAQCIRVMLAGAKVHIRATCYNRCAEACVGILFR